MPTRKLGISLAAVAVLTIAGYWLATRFNINSHHQPGDELDSYNGVKVYYNGGVNQSAGRNLTADGYNLGIRYQCVEFVKRYYYQRFGHKMPDAMGHAKSFFDARLGEGELNPKRMLVQYRNYGTVAPRAEDMLVFAPWIFNPYGHVAIVTKVEGSSLEIIQQNPGPFGSSREVLAIEQTSNGWHIVKNDRVLGWLRRPNTTPTLPLPPAGAPP